MSHASSRSMSHSRLSAAITLGLVGLCSAAFVSVAPARAASLGAGQSLVVNPGDFPETETFNLLGATLTLRPGVVLAGINASSGSMLLVDGANIASLTNSVSAVGINSSAAQITNASLSNVVGAGLGTGSSNGGPGSQVGVVGSQISGRTTAVNISGNGRVTFARSALSSPNSGMILQAGYAEVADGTTITGGSAGILAGFSLVAQPAGSDPSTWGLVVDNSTVEGVSGPAIRVARLSATRTPQPARIAIRNGAVLRSGNGNLIEVLNDFSAEVSVSNSTLNGNILVADTAVTALTFTDNATLNGIITGPADTTITNGATWNLTGDSSIGDLTLGATGTVKLGDGTAFNTLNVNGDFVGQGGTFVFNSVFGDDSSPSDKVVIAGNSAGTGNIVVNNINGTGAQTGEGIQLISVAGASNAAFVMPGRATAGIYEYLLYKGGVANPNDGAWYLRSTYTGDPCDLNPSLPICAPTDPGTPVDPVAPVIPVDPIDPGSPTDPIPLLRPEPGAYLANQAAAVHMFQQRRHDRGEPAFEHDRAGAWARVGRDQMRTTIAGQVDTRTHTNVLQIGSDLYRWGQTGRGQIGLMLATGEAETQATSRITGYGTRGKVKGDAVGLYGTWVQSAEDSSGLYVDGWLQYGRYDNRVQGDNLPRENYDATTRAASIEAGYGWAFANAERGTWYLQPQAQVTNTDYKGDTLQEVNGTVVEDDRAGGFESRVGVRLFGHDNASGNRVQPFLAVNWLYTERGDSMRFDGERLDARLPTNRYEAQAGAQLRLGQNWSAWGDLRVQRGDSGYKDAGAQLGLRRAW